MTDTLVLRSRGTRIAQLILLTLLIITASAACSSDDDDATAVPLKAFTSPVDGKVYCAWKENPHECPPSPPAPPAAPFAMPDDEPKHESGMSATDFLLLSALFSYHTAYAPYYGSPGYYHNHVNPAWTGYPGTYYSGPNRPTIRTGDEGTYRSTADRFDRSYAAQERDAAKTATYKTTGGKTFTGSEAPVKAFSGTNVRVDRPAGDAPIGRNGTVQKSTDNTAPKSGSGSSGGKSGYSSGRSSGRRR